MKKALVLNLLFVSTAYGSVTCNSLFTEAGNKKTAVSATTNIENKVSEKLKLPDVIEDLNIIFDHQVRSFNEKGKEYAVYKVNRDKLNDKIFKRFQQNTVEVLISGISGGGFRHIILRVGEKVYDYGSVRESRAGDDFRAPSDRKDAKGVVFHVGQQKIQDMQNLLSAFYQGNNKYNNPPFSAVGGKLILTEENGKFKFKSAENVWITGGGSESVSITKNNDYFDGQIVEEVSSNGSKKLMLENPMGLRIPLGTQADGQHFVEGFSCASSAVFVLDVLFDIKVFKSVSAANLVKKMSEGNNDFESTPDAFIFYGPERKEAKDPFLTASGQYKNSIYEKNIENAKIQEANAPRPTQQVVIQNTKVEVPATSQPEIQTGSQQTSQPELVTGVKTETSIESKPENSSDVVTEIKPNSASTHKTFSNLRTPEPVAEPKKNWFKRILNFFGF